ncbi:MAG: ATP-binding protein [Phormidesmis sp.]
MSNISRRPVIAIAITIIATFFLFIPLGLNSWQSYRTFNRVIARDTQLQHLTDTITYLDEVLTMSARMSAATGDQQWEKRYMAFVPQLDAAIQNVNDLSADFYKTEGTAETEAANDRLVAMEDQAFKLVRNGDLKKATQLLGGRQYAQQKTIYTTGVQRSKAALTHKANIAQRKFSQSLWVSSAISGLSLLALSPMWIGVLKMLDQYLKALALERHKTKQLTANLEQRVEQRTRELTEAIQDLQQTQSQLVQTEKLSSLGEMVAGIAHEINNPISFIQGNIPILERYFEDLLDLITLYQTTYPQPASQLVEKQTDIEIDFLFEDLPKVLASMNMGTTRVHDIVVSLRNYSRLDEAVLKDVDIHEGLESTLLILNHRIKGGIEVIKNYGALPSVVCSPSQLNQVFTNIIVNAIDAMMEKTTAVKQLILTTHTVGSEHVQISIQDTGGGMPPELKHKIFDPFFTTKPVGKGTGLGLGICFKIIERHQGTIEVVSEIGKGTEFIITLPIRLAALPQ